MNSPSGSQLRSWTALKWPDITTPGLHCPWSECFAVVSSQLFNRWLTVPWKTPELLTMIGSYTRAGDYNLGVLLSGKSISFEASELVSNTFSFELNVKIHLHSGRNWNGLSLSMRCDFRPPPFHRDTQQRHKQSLSNWVADRRLGVTNHTNQSLSHSVAMHNASSAVTAPVIQERQFTYF